MGKPRTLVYGVGVNDFWKEIKDGTFEKIVYQRWRSILARTHSESTHKNQPTYKSVTICDRWKSFTNFYVDFCEMLNSTTLNVDELQVDKDILGKSSIYSPESCVLVPAKLNLFFRNNPTGIFKRGVGRAEGTQKFKAACRIGGVFKHIGVYDTEDEAHLAYCRVKEEEAKRLAQDFEGAVDFRVIEILRNYKVSEYE